MSQETIAFPIGGGHIKAVTMDVPANSYKSKAAGEDPERPKVEQIVHEGVTIRKRSASAKVFSNFFSEDSGTVFSYVLMDVLVPAAKNAITDAVSQGIERLLFGDARPRASSRPDRSNYVNYSQASRQRTEAERRPMTRQARATHDFADIILSTRSKAEDVLDGMRELLDRYNVVSVSELYEFLGETAEFTDNKFGWRDLTDARVRAVRGGYMLILPKPETI